MRDLRIADLMPNVGEVHNESPPEYSDELISVPLPVTASAAAPADDTDMQTVPQDSESSDINLAEYDNESDIKTERFATVPVDIPTKKPKTTPRKIYYVGMFSAALSMVVLGLSFIIALFTIEETLNVLRLSPIVLVFLGLEVLGYWFFRRGSKIRFDVSGYVAMLIMVAIAAGLSALSIVVSNSDSARINLERRYENEIQNSLSKDLENIVSIKDITVSFTSYESDIGVYSGINDIKDTDKLELKFYFRNTQKTLMAFARECREILKVLNTYDMPLGNISFIADDTLSAVRVNINGKFERDISENELARLAFYFASDFDADLVDYE
ncbi:MAG: hypothetical protein FWH05_04885 [Oscillospiraceae bacterium]|nr:hypothetical protein [Oscillospiraceae bacterium]